MSMFKQAQGKMADLPEQNEPLLKENCFEFLNQIKA